MPTETTDVRTLDIVTRLRGDAAGLRRAGGYLTAEIFTLAADEIERLKSELAVAEARLEEVLSAGDDRRGD